MLIDSTLAFPSDKSPPAILQQLRLGKLRHVETSHCFSELFACFKNNGPVPVMHRGFDYRSRAGGGVRRLEDARADKYRFRSELHAQRCIRRCRDASCCKVGHREPALSRNQSNDLVRRAQILCLAHQLFFSKNREPLDVASDFSKVPHRFDDVSGTRFAFCPDHRRSFADAPESFAEIARATYKWNLESMLVDVMLFIRRSEHFAFIDEVNAQ